VPWGGGVTCTGVGEGATSVSRGGSAAELILGGHRIPAKMARIARPTASWCRAQRVREMVDLQDGLMCLDSLASSVCTSAPRPVSFFVSSFGVFTNEVLF
jgi:hypothetical protein